MISPVLSPPPFRQGQWEDIEPSESKEVDYVLLLAAMFVR